ncbi:MAG TPA: MlaD family protein, partial [Planctomycetota bacterium]|nr:MlaD family protein [Planctomycetota bacterium]
MAEYRRAEIISGSFIVLSVLVFGLFAFKVGGLSLDFLFREEGAEFVAYFDDVKTLDVQSKVAAGGLRVGFVKSLEPVALPWTAADLDALRDRGAPIDRAVVGRIRSQVKVTFVVTATDLRLGEDASARIEQEGFIGPFFVALDPGTWPADAPPPTVAAAGPRKTPLPTRGAGGIVDEALMMVRPTVRRIESILAKVDADLLAEENRDHLRNILPLLTGNLEEA